MGKIMIDADSNFFELPGIKNKIKSFENQLYATSKYLDHVIISGPAGVGKDYFVRFAIKYLPYPDVIWLDCESFPKEKLVKILNSYINLKNVLIFLDHLEKFPHGEQQALYSLMKKVRVVATTREDLPGALNSKFKISIEVPPLYCRRDDIFYFIAKNYPSLRLSNVNLIRLYAYHWPENFPELDKTLHRLLAEQDLESDSGLFEEQNLPPDIAKKVPEDKLLTLFLTLCKNGLSEFDLEQTHDTCFSNLIPWVTSKELSHIDVELKFKNGDSSSDLEALIDSNTSDRILNGIEICRVFKCFFELFYGRKATFHNQTIFELQPFTFESYKIIEQAQSNVYQWKLGNSYAFTYDFNYSYFQHLSRSLKLVYHRQDAEDKSVQGLHTPGGSG